MRLAVLFKRPLHEVAAWSAAEVDLIIAFLAREPSPEVRLEIAVARLTEITVMLMGSGSAKPGIMDFLPFLDAWKAPVVDDTRYNETDLEVLKLLGVK